MKRKVRDARIDWVGYDCVIGDREMAASSLRVFDREANETREMTSCQLVDEIRSKTVGKPFRKTYFPRDVSRRPSRGR